jgi:hypothetical protein
MTPRWLGTCAEFHAALNLILTLTLITMVANSSLSRRL